MSDYAVVVIGGARARFFTLEPVEFPDLESGPRLVERGELLNPEGRLPERDLYADSKTGRGRAPGGRAHGYDDHRSEHDEEIERRFTRQVLERANQLAQEHQARSLILAAPSRLLGFLRPDLDGLIKQGIEVKKLAKDMIKLSSDQIQAHLAKEDLLPERRRPGAQPRPQK